jgi:hypothetical protein
MSSPWDAIIARSLSRRTLLAGGPGSTAVAFLGGFTAGEPLLGFASVPPSTADPVVVPPGYEWKVLHAWGDPVLPGAPEFKPDASQSADDQARQAGMGHDGMEYFPLPKGSTSSDHGLIAINYEYGDDHLLTTEGMIPWRG